MVYSLVGADDGDEDAVDAARRGLFAKEALSEGAAVATIPARLVLSLPRSVLPHKSRLDALALRRPECGAHALPRHATRGGSLTPRRALPPRPSLSARSAGGGAALGEERRSLGVGALHRHAARRGARAGTRVLRRCHRSRRLRRAFLCQLTRGAQLSSVAFVRSPGARAALEGTHAAHHLAKFWSVRDTG